MSKLHTEIENIFKFRLLSNADISEYIIRMSRMGKIDEPRKIALFNLILTRLGQLEDEAETILPPANTAYLMPDVPDRRLPVNTPIDMSEKKEEDTAVSESFPCPECDMVAKSALGLVSHSRKHKKVI